MAAPGFGSGAEGSMRGGESARIGRWAAVAAAVMAGGAGAGLGCAGPTGIPR